MYINFKSPLLVQWEVTYDCNKNCVHCYNYWRTDNCKVSNNSKLNKIHSEYIVNEILKNEVFHVVVTGGEPLLVFDELYPYLKRLHDNNIKLSLNSNLMIMTDEIAKKLKSVGINGVLVSFPAHNEMLDYQITGVKNSFKKTIEGIKCAKRNGLSITTNMVVTRLNYNHIYETAKLAKTIGANKFSINRSMKPENCKNFDQYQISLEQYKNIPAIMKKIKDEIGIDVLSVEANPLCFINDYNLLKEVGFSRTCSAGKTFCAIDPTGNIRPCILISDNYGNNLSNAWKNMEVYRNESMLPKECNNCTKKDTCDGGCKAERKHICGDLKKIDPYADLSNIFSNKEKLNISSDDIVLNKETVYQVNDKVIFRKEDFGGLIYLSTKYFVAVEDSLFDFLRANKEFEISYLMKELKYTYEEAIKTIKYLNIKHILIQKNI